MTDMRLIRLPLLLASAFVFGILFLGSVSLPARAAPVLDFGKNGGSTADHSTFEILKQEFETGPEVTKACLSCHAKAAQQIHKTKHWTWDYENPVTGQRVGKRNVVNNFCISAEPNIAACSSCHIGYGWEDDSYDFASEENVDCLVCHDTTRTYSKAALADPDKKRKPNLSKIAREVGPTSRATCGSCHFAGGGAKAVKHGDMDPTLVHPDFFVDVHMDAEGLNFSCSTCHTSDQHVLAGSRYAPTAKDTHGIDVPGSMEGGRASCESCHGLTPHPEENHPKLNDHTDRVACQTCHIPRLARGDFASKNWWDWSTAGQRKPDGSILEKHAEDGAEIYNSKKGDFIWEDWFRPQYAWFNGTVRYTLVGDEVAPDGIVPINRIEGSADDPNARIWPFKVMRGKQPYDSERNSLVAVLTTTPLGYWTTFNWDTAITLGMAAVEKPYSGKYGFVETSMHWPIAHMVAPAKEALACNDCHTKDSLLADLSGFYMPGRDSYAWLSQLGWIAVVLTLVGVIGHLALRILLYGRKK